MKLIISLCAVIAVVSAVEQDVYTLSPESLSKLNKIALPCAQEFNVDPIIITKLGDDTLPRDEATNNFLHCYAMNSGFVDKEGHFVVEKLALVVRNHPRVQEFKEALRKCTEQVKENSVANTVALHVCYSANSPILFGYTES